jgi:hypothetical protein
MLDHMISQLSPELRYSQCIFTSKKNELLDVVKKIQDKI